jgi:hypothetical protein
MLFNDQPAPPQLCFHYCRNSRCGSRLEIPTDDRRKAFCTPGCEAQYFERHCRVCEQPISRKTARRQVCGRSRCRHEIQRHPEAYALRLPGAGLGHNAPETGSGYGYATLGHNGSRSAHSTGLKFDEKPGRGYPTDPKIAAANAANAKHWRQFKQANDHKAIFQRDTPPLNVIGGYRFPNAPKVNLYPPPAPLSGPPRAPASALAAPPLGDELEIPHFLRRRQERGPTVPPSSPPESNHDHHESSCQESERELIGKFVAARTDGAPRANVGLMSSSATPWFSCASTATRREFWRTASISRSAGSLMDGLSH